MILSRPFIAALLLATSNIAIAQPAPLAPDQVFVNKMSDGVEVTPNTGPAVRLQVYGDRIIRVTRSATGKFDLPPSLAVTARPAHVPFKIIDAPGNVTLATPFVRATVNFADGKVTFVDATGRPISPRVPPAPSLP